MEGANITNSNSNSNSNPLLNSGGGGMEGVISPPFQSLLSKVGGGGEGNGRVKRGRLPNPREMVAHYESQGMEREAASLKVIDDLQHVLYNLVSSTSTSTKGGGGGGGSQKSASNAVNRRLAMLEMKLDSKPGYSQTLSIGVASGAISSALASIWKSVRRSSSSNP